MRMCGNDVNAAGVENRSFSTTSLVMIQRFKIQKTLLSISNITLKTEIVLQLHSKVTVIILVSHNIYG